MKKKLQGTDDTYIPNTQIDLEEDEDLEKLHNHNLRVYVNRLDQEYNQPGEINIRQVIQGPIDFADKEAEQYIDKSTLYFKKEICDIELILGSSILYMIENAKNNLSKA